MKYIENVVIGRIDVPAQDLFAVNTTDWQENEFSKTFNTNEKFLPRYLLT